MSFYLAKYKIDNSIYIGINFYNEEYEQFELWNDLTIYLDSTNTNDILKDNEIYINNDLSNELKNKLIELGFIKLLNKKVYQGFGEYEKAKINIDKIKEYTIKED
jgi:hypothetical protein